MFSKIFEETLLKQLTAYLDQQIYLLIENTIQLKHVLIRLIEEWKTNLDKNYIVGAVLMDLSEAFDCIPHDLLIAKLDGYGFDKESLIYIYPHLHNRKQFLKINNHKSSEANVILRCSTGFNPGSNYF